MASLSKFFKRFGRTSRRWEDEGESENFEISPRAPVAAKRESALPQFRGMASELSPRSRDKGVSQVRMRLRTAFTPSQPVSDVRKFAGRTEVLKTLIRSIEDQQLHVVLYGERGIGKTSLLHVLAELSRKARYIVRYTSCGEGTDFSEIFRTIAGDIPLLYHADYDPTSEAIERGGVLADLLPPGPLTVSQISEMFAKVSNTRVIIILDEFDRSDSEVFRRLIAELVKNLSDRAIRVQLVIAGVASNLTELIAHIPSIRRNIIGLPVPPMNEEEVRELVMIGEAVSGLSFEDAAMERIISVSNGSPYLASLLSQHAGLVSTERNAVEVSHADVDLAVDRTLYEIELRMSPHTLHFIAQLERQNRGALLQILAQAAISHGGRIDGEAIALSTSGKGGAAQIADLANLIEPIPDDPGDAYRFREEGAALFLWMQRAAATLKAEAA